MGVDADVSTGDLRVSELRNFGNIALGDYHIPERFLDRFTMHVVKNMLVVNNTDIGRVPLILGIWGGKGGGKSFNVELCCRELGITPIVTSAGERTTEPQHMPSPSPFPFVSFLLSHTRI